MKYDLREISNSSLFKGISEEELKAMFKCLNAMFKEYKKGEYISISENIIGFVINGEVSILSDDIWGNSSLLSVVKEKNIFGETFACSKGTNDMISFAAKTDCTLLFLDYHKVLNTCTTACLFHHKLIENIVKLIAEKNYAFMKKINIISQRTLKKKILEFLSYEANKNNSLEFTISMGRIEMAEYLAADRTALSRELKNMKDEGLIDYDKNKFRLL